MPVGHDGSPTHSWEEKFLSVDTTDSAWNDTLCELPSMKHGLTYQRQVFMTFSLKLEINPWAKAAQPCRKGV